MAQFGGFLLEFVSNRRLAGLRFANHAGDYRVASRAKGCRRGRAAVAIRRLTLPGAEGTVAGAAETAGAG